MGSFPKGLCMIVSVCDITCGNFVRDALSMVTAYQVVLYIILRMCLCIPDEVGEMGTIVYLDILTGLVGCCRLVWVLWVS